MLGKNLKDFICPEDQEKYTLIKKNVRETGSPIKASYNRIKCKQGSYKWLSWSVVPDLNKNTLYCVARDITKKREQEEALQESEQRYRQLVELSPDSIIVYHEAEDQITFANTAAVRLWGVTSVDDLVGKKVRELFLENQESQIKKQWDQLTTGYEENKIIRSDGQIIDVESRSSTLSFKSKNVRQVVIRDITERKKIEAEIFKASKLESLGILAGGIAHDFNNLLTIILGNASLVKMRINPKEKNAKNLMEIEKAIIQAKDLTQQLLTFAKGSEPLKRNIDIGELLQETTSLILSGSNIKCNFHIAQDLTNIEADEGQIKQVINNILINAIQAMPNGGSIKVAAENKESSKRIRECFDLGHDYVKITIADGGTGISEESLQHIFDPYFTTKAEGNGLGLANVYSIIKKHNGFINVESQVGVGTTFHLYLLASKQKKTTQIANKGVFVTDKHRILVVDDKEEIRKVAVKMLKQLNYAAACARDGAQAIEMYQRAQDMGKSYEVIIMDLTIPGGMGGEQTIGQLLQINKRAKVIACSGYANSQIMSKYKQMGFKGFISKPYNIEQLEKILGEVIVNCDESAS